MLDRTGDNLLPGVLSPNDVGKLSLSCVLNSDWSISISVAYARIACKVVIDAIKCCVSDLCRSLSPRDMLLTYEGIFLSAGMETGIKYNQDQSSIMLLLEHNFRHNAVVFRMTLKSRMLKFSSIMYLTLCLAALFVFLQSETVVQTKRRHFKVFT